MSESAFVLQGCVHFLYCAFGNEHDGETVSGLHLYGGGTVVFAAIAVVTIEEGVKSCPFVCVGDDDVAAVFGIAS